MQSISGSIVNKPGLYSAINPFKKCQNLVLNVTIQDHILIVAKIRVNME